MRATPLDYYGDCDVVLPDDPHEEVEVGAQEGGERSGTLKSREGWRTPNTGHPQREVERATMVDLDLILVSRRPRSSF